MRTRVDSPLWLTVRGATLRVAVAWIAWLTVAVVSAQLVGEVLGAAGPVVAVLAVGWLLARQLPAPVEYLRRYHLDDDELTVMGPGRRVRRLKWNAVTSITEQPFELRVGGPGVNAALPLASLLDDDGLLPVLERVIPALAEELWDSLEDGIVRFVPIANPTPEVLAWWAYLPAAAGCLLGWSVPGLAVLVTVATLERVVMGFLGRRHTITLHPAGVAFPGMRGGWFAPWSHAVVSPSPLGLRVALPEQSSAVVLSTLPNFWAVAAVIQLRAQLGSATSVRVHFRVRMEGRAVAVVGVVEADALS